MRCEYVKEQAKANTSVEYSGAERLEKAEIRPQWLNQAFEVASG